MDKTIISAQYSAAKTQLLVILGLTVAFCNIICLVVFTVYSPYWSSDANSATPTKRSFGLTEVCVNSLNNNTTKIECEIQVVKLPAIFGLTAVACVIVFMNSFCYLFVHVFQKEADQYLTSKDKRMGLITIVLLFIILINLNLTVFT
ncbi:unnamed protein product, partial [Didymodactylos carnosus]